MEKLILARQFELFLFFKIDSTSKSQTYQPSSVTHEDVPKRIMSNKDEEGDLKHDLDVLTSNTTTRNTDVDDNEQDFDFTTKFKTHPVSGSQKIISKTNKKAKSNVDDDDDGGSNELHLVIYKDIPKKIMKKKVNDKEEEKDDNAKQDLGSKKISHSKQLPLKAPVTTKKINTR
ncbi:hypothetical protein RclHR1_15340001 [Rhizophagus clarus]|uniref:Uncharacterized protein n=1 Tax=Rhizophagus clarus TaxID=94130 RepID=A0A2Z6QEW6_9GLOM|nr:hypothetical protein RclHR1_15340001 [Rhizophagus clarus]